MRLKQHQRDRLQGKWDRFSVYLTARDEHIKELESLILRIVVPTGNRTGGRLAKSQDLRRVIHRLIAESDADNRKTLMGDKRRLCLPVKKTAKKQPKKKTKTQTGRPQSPLGKRRVLQGHHKGWEYRAILRPDGTIRYGQRTFQSPSAAAGAAVGRACNGWTFWRYRDGSGDWVPLKNLRP